MKTRYISIVLTSLFLLSASLAFGQGPKRGRGSGPEGQPPLRALERILDLNEEQAAAIQQLHQENRVETRELMKEQRELRRQLRDEVKAEEPSLERIGELVLALEDFRTQMRENREALKASMEEVLTPEQLEQLDNLKAFRGRRGSRHRDRN